MKRCEGAFRVNNTNSLKKNKTLSYDVTDSSTNKLKLVGCTYLLFRKYSVLNAPLTSNKVLKI